MSRSRAKFFPYAHEHHSHPPRRLPLSPALTHGVDVSVLGSWADDEGGVMWDAHAIAHAVHGKVLAEGGAGSICTDTRTMRAGQWFLALTGHNFDGHSFLYQACEKQCAGVVANWVPHGWSRGFVQVEGDTLDALQALASDVRARFWGPVVGLTGSVGKTTARAMTTLALQGLNGHVHQAPGNFNNDIGVALTLLRLNSRSVACVLELGMNHAGEILELANTAKPDVRVLLNVGPAHMENFPGGLEEVAAAKGEIFRNARPGDLCIVNADDPLAMAVPLPAGVRVVRFGRKEGSDMRLVAAKTINRGFGISVILEHVARYARYANSLVSDDPVRNPNETVTRTRVEFEIPSPGLHLAINACAAAAVATNLGVPLESVARSLSMFQPIDMRCQVEAVGPASHVQILVINDCYNANPMSVEASLQLLQSVKSNRRIALLGDMFELGEISLSSHKGILQLCVDFKLDLVIVVGTCFSEAAEYFKGRDIIAFRNTSSLTNHLARFISPGDSVLVKGSRGMRMEVLVEAIKSCAESWQSTEHSQA